MKAALLPVSSPLAGHMIVLSLKKATANSIRAPVAIESRIWATESRKPSTVCPRHLEGYQHRRNVHPGIADAGQEQRVFAAEEPNGSGPGREPLPARLSNGEAGAALQNGGELPGLSSIPVRLPADRRVGRTVARQPRSRPATSP